MMSSAVRHTKCQHAGIRRSATLSSLLMFTSRFSSVASHFFAPSSSTQITVPHHLLLQNVIIFTRHGDRSQISKSIGQNYPENDYITNQWKTKLPSESITQKLKSVAIFHSEEDHHDEIYAGWDHVNSPYGMLTHAGSEQLINVGSVFRKRYEHLLTSNFSDSIYTRSTNLCRTILSLRSLLKGFLPDDELHPSKVPKIVKRLRTLETLYPQADGACPALAERRKEILGKNYLSEAIHEYDNFENKIKGIFGYSTAVNWLEVKEVLTCHLLHGIKLPEGITEVDIDKATEITGYTWGALYNDDILNKIAIGRFLTELLDDISHIGDSAATANKDIANDKLREGSRKDVAENANILIYSGHDSTLVPILCALGIYDYKWPPYASYLALEVAEEKLPSGSKLWVRAIYNDEALAIGSKRPFIGQCVSDVMENWYPYDMLISRLQSLSIDHDDYSMTCQAAAESATAAEANQLAAEIRATIGSTTGDKK